MSCGMSTCATNKRLDCSSPLASGHRRKRSDTLATNNTQQHPHKTNHCHTCIILIYCLVSAMADSADWVTVGGASKGDSHAHGKDSKRVVRGDQGGRSREPRRADKREGEKKEKGEERPSRSPVKKPARVAKEVVEAPVAAEAAPASVDGKLSFRAALLTAKAAGMYRSRPAHCPLLPSA